MGDNSSSEYNRTLAGGAWKPTLLLISVSHEDRREIRIKKVFGLRMYFSCHPSASFAHFQLENVTDLSIAIIQSPVGVCWYCDIFFYYFFRVFANFPKYTSANWHLTSKTAMLHIPFLWFLTCNFNTICDAFIETVIECIILCVRPVMAKILAQFAIFWFDKGQLQVKNNNINARSASQEKRSTHRVTISVQKAQIWMQPPPLININPEQAPTRSSQLRSRYTS